VTTGCSLVNLEDFILVCMLFEQMGDIRGLIEISVWMLTHSTDRSMYCYIIDTFKKHEVAYVAIGRTNKIFMTLFGKHLELKEKNSVHVEILVYLLRITGYMALSCVNDEQVLELNEDFRCVSTPSKTHVEYRPSDLPLNSDAYSQQAFFRKYSMSEEACSAIYEGMTAELATYSLHASSFESRRRMDEYCVILKGLANTFVSGIVLRGLRSRESGWNVAWIVSLLVNGCCGVAAVLQGFCLPVLNEFLETLDVCMCD
jgi:hypothetical protein